MRRVFELIIGLIIVALAATGSLMAFGVGAAWAVLASMFVPRRGLSLARASARRAKTLLVFIFSHSGLPEALGPALRVLKKIFSNSHS